MVAVQRVQDAIARLIVPTAFFLIFLAVCTGLAALAQQPFALRFWLPHTPMLDFIYKIVDPYAVFVVSAAYVFAKLGVLVVPFEKGRRWKSVGSAAATLVMSGAFFVGLYVAEAQLLKPVFSISRPAFWVERSVVRDLLIGDTDDTRAAHSLRLSDFRQSFSRIVVRAALADTSGHVSPESVRSALIATGLSSGAAKQAVASALAGRGLPGKMPSFAYRARLLGQMTAWLSKGIQPLLVARTRLENPNEDKRDSMPSGHVLRQIVVLFVGLFMILQRPEVRRRAFGGWFEQAFLVVIVSLSFVLVAFSRLYGFQHSLADEMMAAGFPVVLLPLLVFAVHWGVAQKAERDRAAHDRVVQSVPDLLYQTDDQGNLTYTNQGFASMFGYASKEEMRAVESIVVDGVKVLPIESFWVYPEHRKLLLAEVETRKGRVLDYFCYVRSKRRRPFYLSVDSVWIGDGPKKGIGGTGREVTSKVRVYDGFYQTNKDGVITFCDEKFARRFGYVANDLIGKDIAHTLFLAPDAWTDVLRRLGQKLFGSETLTAITQGGQVIRIEFANHLIMQGPAVCGVEGTIRPSRPQGVYVIQNGKFVYADAEFRRIFAYSEKQIREMRSYLDLVAPDDRDKVRREVERKLIGGPSQPYEFLGIRADTRTVGVICDSGQGTYKGAPAVIGTILEARIGSEILERLQQREWFSALGRAANDLTHWLGNVVPAILGAVLFMRQDLDAADAAPTIRGELRSHLDAIESNARLVARMKRDLTSTPDTVNTDEVGFLNSLSMASLAKYALSTLKIPAVISVHQEIPPEIPAVSGQGPALLKVLTYLAKNAIEAMPNGGTLTLAGSFRPETRTYVISVQDTGVGIDPADRGRVFSPFWSTKPASTESGLGLGLWYCRSALDSMNADIDFASEVGSGTRFDLVFYGLAKEKTNG